jgi:hypothetical protein
MNASTFAAPVAASARDRTRGPDLLARVLEYCGIRDGDADAVFVCARPSGCEGGWERCARHPAELASELVESGAEVSRSMWDRKSLLVHLDLDYLNVDRPDEPFTHPAEVFFKLEATFRAMWAEWTELGGSPLAIATGEGYHFVGSIPLDGDVFSRLAALGPSVPGWQTNQASRMPDWIGDRVSELHARARTGLGLVLEHLAQRILARVTSASRIPVVLDGTVVGSGLVGRECVSIDLTQFADPLDVRHVRVPFGIYRKFDGHPPVYAIPRRGEDLVRFLEGGRDEAHARRVARDFDARIPDVSAAMRRLLESYAASPLGEFHREFSEGDAGSGPSAWERRLDPASLPPCVAACLLRPNDLLLRPAQLQNLTRALLARDWRAHEIASEVERRYREDHGWGDRWSLADPEVRAEGYVRAFAGLVHAGADRLIDFNCVSTQEKGMCPGGCHHDLREDVRRINERRAR